MVIRVIRIVRVIRVITVGLSELLGLLGLLELSKILGRRGPIIMVEHHVAVIAGLVFEAHVITIGVTHVGV
jgi:hypothetical protein